MVDEGKSPRIARTKANRRKGTSREFHNTKRAGLANDPAGLSTNYCEARAEEARVKAEAMTDLEARKTMLRVAEMWAAMAEAAARRSR